MSDKLKGDGTPVGATAVNSVNGKTGPTVVLYGDDIGPPGTGPAPSALGCVKAGTNIAIAADGTISASARLVLLGRLLLANHLTRLERA